MRHTGNFNLEWGYLAPAPSFLRSVRLVVVAGTVAAIASAGAVFALVRQPAAEASVASRTLVLPGGNVSAPLAVAALQTPPDHASMPKARHAAGETRRQTTPAVSVAAIPSAAGASAPQRSPIAGPDEAESVPLAARTMIAAATDPASARKTPKRKARGVAQGRDSTGEAARLRIASARHNVKPVRQPPAHDVVRNTVVREDDNAARDDDSLLGRTMGVTDHVIAATQRAVSTIGVIPSWIGSMGNRLGG